MENPNLKKSILVTLTYFDVFEYPLTILEIKKYLYQDIADLGRIVLVLDELIADKKISEKDGFYFVSGKENALWRRKSNNRLARKKWQKIKKITRYLALAPFLRLVLASGSLAISNADKKSDLDVMIIAESGRIFTCRMFMLMITNLLGKRRKGRLVKDRICLNHYLTTESLAAASKNLYIAFEFGKLIPLLEIKKGTYEKMTQDNSWIKEYLPAYPWGIADHEIRINRFYRAGGRALEFMLTGKIGGLVESFFQWVQTRRLDYQKGRIIATESQLEFHPHPQEVWVPEKLKANFELYFNQNLDL